MLCMSISFISSLIFIISFFLSILGFDCYYFSSSIWCKFTLFNWGFCCFLKLACITINFPLRSAFVVPIDFGSLYFHFLLSAGIFYCPFWFLCWPISCLVACCLVSMCLCFYQFSSFSWFLVSCPCRKKRCLTWS